jgi:hypothetical protein
MARETDALTLAALHEDARPVLRWVLRPVAAWWALERWWLFHLAWSPPLVALSRSKRARVAKHRAHDFLIPPYAAAALDRAAEHVLRHEVERRIKSSAAPWRWEGQQVAERPSRAPART